MKKMIEILIVTLLIGTAFPTIAQIERNVENERFNEKEPKMINFNIWEGQLTSYSEYSTKCRVEPFDVHRIYPKTSHHINSNSDIVYIFVPSTIYENISFELSQYSNDLEVMGFSIEIYTGLWGTSQEVRSFLQMLYSEDVIGCLFIGDIPVAWYEQQAFDEHEEFPIDLYYMDLDGVWYDNDHDGIYDGHSGQKNPEIWVGRLKADVLSGGEIELLKNYFSKCHQYRIKSYDLPNRALVYIDDDWVDDFGHKWNNEVDNAFSDTNLVLDKWTTDAGDYKNKLVEGYKMVHLAVHSSYYRHHFKNPDGWSGTVSSIEIQSLDPHVFFYNMFACSAARYIESNYFAGWYIFTDSYGLLSVGSTKVGGMWKSSSFYTCLGDDYCFGDAFKEWFIQEGISRPDWFYGMTIIGDPILPHTYNEPLNNLPPEKPECPSGETTVKIDEIYFYNTTTSDPDGDKIWFKWDWGDGNYSDWMGAFITGEVCTANYNWSEKNGYEIRVKAMDIQGIESEWSDPLAISMPKNKAVNTPFLNFLEQHPYLFPLLRHLMGV